MLLVQSAFSEPGRDPATVAAGLRHALDELASFVGAERWEVNGAKGDLIPLLR